MINLTDKEYMALKCARYVLEKEYKRHPATYVINIGKPSEGEITYWDALNTLEDVINEYEGYPLMEDLQEDNNV